MEEIYTQEILKNKGSQKFGGRERTGFVSLRRCVGYQLIADRHPKVCRRLLVKPTSRRFETSYITNKQKGRNKSCLFVYGGELRLKWQLRIL